MLPKILEGEKAKFSVKDGYGNKCPFIFANTPLAKRLSGLTQIMDDLLHAKELIQLVYLLNPIILENYKKVSNKICD